MEAIEADVVIVGYGGAGAAAAIAAHDAGAKVLILEKQPEGGGNTVVSGGAFLTPLSREALAPSLDYMNRLNAGSTPPEVMRAFLEEALLTNDWIESLGGRTVRFPPFQGGQNPRPPNGPSFPHVPGAGHTTSYCVDGPESVLKADRLWKLLSSNIERRGIRVLMRAAVKEVMREGGRAAGVVAEGVTVHAKRAVILACGGFEYNEAMKEAFLPCRPFYAAGSPSTTGDGIALAQQAGAALWHMGVVAGWFGYKAPEYPWAIMLRYCGPGFIHVNRAGRRFCDEVARDYHDRWRDFADIDSREDTASPGFPNIPAYGIFDEATRRKGSLRFRPTMPTGKPESIYEWSADNSAEIAKGWIEQADTLPELGRRLGVDGQALEATVRRYNDFCERGADEDFGRTGEMLAALSTPPYYGIEIWPAMLNTLGGPRKDERSRVLGHDGRPIPGLYAVGELGSIWGFLYHGGGNLAECLACGRIAGRNAAAEPEHSKGKA